MSNIARSALMLFAIAASACTPEPHSGYSLYPCGDPNSCERIASGVAKIGWRAAMTNDTPRNRGMAIVLATGGDLSAQRIAAYQRCRSCANCFTCDQNGDLVNLFTNHAVWSSRDFSYNSQVQFADLFGEAAPAVVASSYNGTSGHPHSFRCGAGVRVYRPDPKLYGCTERYPNDETIISPVSLIDNTSIIDFVAQDVNADGRVDLIVAAAGHSESSRCAPTSAAVDDGPPVGHWGLLFEPEDTPPFQFLHSRDEATLELPFVGIYLNHGNAGEPDFNAVPDHWFGVQSDDGEQIRVPSRLTTLDFNQDGWLDIAVAFASDLTAVWLGSNEGYREPEGRRLKAEACTREPGGFWCVQNGAQMTADMTSLVIEGKTLLVETRGCYPGHTEASCGTRAGVYASWFDSRSRTILVERVDRGWPTFVTTTERGDSTALLFGWARGAQDQLEPEMYRLPLVLDGSRRRPQLIAKGVLALSSGGFDVNASTQLVRQNMSPREGPFFVLPGSGWETVESVSSGSKQIPRCGKAEIVPCWDFPSGAASSTPAIVVYHHGGGEIQVTYRPLVHFNQLMPSAQPLVNAFGLGGATVLWHERPKG